MSGPFPDIFVDSKCIGPTDSHLCGWGKSLAKAWEDGCIHNRLGDKLRKLLSPQESFHLFSRNILVALFRPYFELLKLEEIVYQLHEKTCPFQRAQTGDSTEAPAEAVARAAASSVRLGLGSRWKNCCCCRCHWQDLPHRFTMNHQSIQPINSRNT